MSGLAFLIVEDEVLLQMQLGFMLEDAGHAIAASATSLPDALVAINHAQIDVALVDVHLADGPTGLEVGRKLAEAGIPYVFLTANAARIPADYAGGWGVIGKPYTQAAMMAALGFLEAAVREPPPQLPPPAGIQLAPSTERMWRSA